MFGERKGAPNFGDRDSLFYRDAKCVALFLIAGEIANLSSGKRGLFMNDASTLTFVEDDFNQQIT